MPDDLLPKIHSVVQRVKALSDEELLRALGDQIVRSRRNEVVIVAHVAEVDERRLYAREGARSMFVYCIEVLHLSENEAYLRIAVGRAAREHPVLLAMLADGRLHLSGIAKLAPHLSAGNRDALLARATHKTKREIVKMVAALAPQPDVPTVIRRLPQPSPRREQEAGSSAVGAEAAAGLQLGPDQVAPPVLAVPPPPPVVQPLAPARYKFQFTGSEAFRDKLERLQGLMRHAVPDGDLAALLEDAVDEKLARLDARRFGRTDRPRKTLVDADTSASGSRYIPAAVRRAADERDGGQCRYVAPTGRRCSARGNLEFHHHRAHGRGGDRSVANIQLMCPAHNLYLAEQEYGIARMAQHRKRCTLARPADSAPDSS